MGQVSEASALRAVTPEQLQAIDESSQVYLNIRNQRVYMKKNVILADIGDFQYELEIYKFRRLNQMYLVSVDYCSNMKQIEICSSFNTLTYYIEKQEYTLFQKVNASIQEGIRILLHSLQGFKILYQKFGYFTPHSKLIHFNRYHQSRVWLSQRLQTTKNLQNPNGPKNIMLQNTFIRQIVHIFDGIRDPLCPMFRYSDFLPMHFLSFREVEDIFHKKQMEVIAQKQVPFQAFRQIQNIRKQNPQQLSIKDLVFGQKSQTISCQNSPMNSPRNSKMIEVSKRQYQPKMNFVYKTPPKLQCFQYPSQQHEQIKLATKMSLKNTIPNGRSSYQQQMCMKQSPSTIPASTMPASVKKSGVFEKCIIIQKLDPSPLNSGNISSINCQKDNKSLKQQAAQRYSEAEKPLVCFQVSPINKRLKVSLEQKASYMTNQMERSQLRLSQNNEPSNSSSNNFMQKRINNQSGPNFNEGGTRPNFQHHKRHQTDFKMLSKMSNQSRCNQTSMIEGNYLSKFHLNTIKSIHLLDEDRQMDREIIVDLKQIINKYRKLG